MKYLGLKKSECSKCKKETTCFAFRGNGKAKPFKFYCVECAKTPKAKNK